jgi:hypothetical protein
MMNGLKVKLTAIKGDQEEFADLIGTTGKLFLEHDREWYHPATGEPVVLSRKRVVKKGSRIQVFTHLGNVFTFWALPGAGPP